MARTDEALEECLKEMFRRVGSRYSRRFCKRADWYRTRSWTDAEETDFKKWMVGHLRKRCRWTKRTAEKEAGWFVLMYGWRSAPSDCLKPIKERRTA